MAECKCLNNIIWIYLNIKRGGSKKPVHTNDNVCIAVTSRDTSRITDMYINVFQSAPNKYGHAGSTYGRAKIYMMQTV